MSSASIVRLMRIGIVENLGRSAVQAAPAGAHTTQEGDSDSKLTNSSHSAAGSNNQPCDDEDAEAASDDVGDISNGAVMASTQRSTCWIYTYGGGCWVC